MTTQREFHLKLEQSAPAVSESLINTVVVEDFPKKKRIHSVLP